MNGRKPFSLQSQTGNVNNVAYTGALVSFDFYEVDMWEVQCRLETVGALRVLAHACSGYCGRPEYRLLAS